MNYFINWGHAYIVHFGVWFSFAFACSIYKSGIPEPKNLGGMLSSAVILSAILGIVSSHSQIHFLTQFVK